MGHLAYAKGRMPEGCQVTLTIDRYLGFIYHLYGTQFHFNDNGTQAHEGTSWSKYFFSFGKAQQEYLKISEGLKLEKVVI